MPLQFWLINGVYIMRQGKACFLLLMTFAGACGSAQQRDPFPAFLEHLGVQPCAAESIKESTLTLSGVYVDNDMKRCVLWKNAIRGIDIVSAYTIISGKKLPIVIYYRNNDKENREIHTLTVRLVGGPGGNIAPQPHDDFFDKIYDDGPMIVIGYTGTMYNSRFPNSDFEEACSDISEYISNVLKNNRGIKVNIIGESLGSTIAACAAKHSPVDNLILLSPLARSPASAYKYFLNLSQYSNYDEALNIRTMPSRGRMGLWQSIPSLQAFKDFFPKKDQNTSLLSRLQTLKIPITIVYGSEDKKIGIDAFKDSSFKRMKVIAIPGAGHSLLDEPQARHLREAIFSTGKG